MKFLADENNVKVMGRTLFINGIRYLNYSASSIEFEFKGKKAAAEIWTNGAKGDEHFKGWMAVYINDKLYKKFCLNKEIDNYILYEGSKVEKVNVKLVKLSEASFSKAGIKSIYIDSNEGIEAVKENERKIEIIGDSITCGYGIEGKLSINCFKTSEENVMLTYGVKIADYFKADVNLISYSSKGVITSSVDKNIDDAPKTDWLMPEVYKYTDLGMSKELNIKEAEVWDSKRFIPDIIIINLGTNDQTYTRDIKTRIASFGKGYYKFIDFIRMHNKSTSIICTLGVMGQELCPEIEAIVKRYNENNNDNNVYFMAFDVQKEEDGIGTHEHPSYKTHEKMAAKLIDFIKNIKGWE